MTQYAQYNPALSPAPVIAWFDTDEFDYPNLPPASDLLEVTPAQWSARLTNPSGWAISNGELIEYTQPISPLTLAQQAIAALSAGIAITSTSTPSLNGVYACDSSTQGKINGIVNYIGVNSKFPASLSEMPWPDIDGTVHMFPSTASFLAFGSAVANYVVELEAVVMGLTSTLPSASVTIA